jgi:two-component system, NtrC family, response regulator AtoC
MTQTTRNRPRDRVRVLVVEDDAGMLKIVTRHLDRMGYAVRGFTSGAQALEAVEDRSPQVIVSDIRMPGMDGRTLLQIVHDKYPAIRVVLMTAFGNVDDAVEAMKAGAYSYLCKPFKMDEVASVLRNISRELALEQQVSTLQEAVGGRYTADRLIGQSAPMRRARSQIREAAALSTPVCITGRSGTGKELAARAIHFESSRTAKPFIPVNCAAIPAPLFESEMFGHAKGAFTGAEKAQKGLIELSSGGTLFLDEVGEIPFAQQAKLLRVLDQRELRPLGSPRDIPVDLRIVSATNRSLEAMVRQGQFREDLFYRINVFHVAMPELSARPSDIPPLAEHLLVELSADNNAMRSPGFTDDALTALAQHRWPGNVRELRNVIERAMASAAGQIIDLGLLPPPLSKSQSQSATDSPPQVETIPPDLDLTLAEVEHQHIERVLTHCQWNRSTAAKILGIDRRTLYSKIQKYGLITPRAKSRS